MQLHSINTMAQDATEVARLRPRGKPCPTIATGAAISYARISRSVQKSITAQWKLNDKTAAEHGITRQVYLKDEQSGLDTDRAGYQELLRLARTREYEAVLLYAADRLARDDNAFIDVCRELLALGMRLWQYNAEEVTTRNVNELGAKAYAEVRRTANRTQDGVEIRASEGVKLGQPLLGYIHKPAPGMDADGKYQRYGYTDDGKPDQYDHHPVIGPAITEMYERCAAGEAIGPLRRWFNETTGLQLRPHDLKRLLRHEYYKGMTVGCKERCSKKELDGHYARPHREWQVSYHDKPLTDPDTWDRVQARLNSQSVPPDHHAAHQRQTPSRYALTGLVWCAHCNARMWGHGTGSRSSNYKCYICERTKGIKMVERAVASTLTHVTINVRETMGELATRMGTTQSEIDAKIVHARAELDRVQEHRTDLGMAVTEGKIDDEQYHRGLARYDRQGDELRQQIRDLEERRAHLPAPMDLAQLDIERLPTGGSMHAALMRWPVERTQELYKTCIKRVVIDADNNKVRIEYVDHFRPIWGPAIEVTLSRKKR